MNNMFFIFSVLVSTVVGQASFESTHQPQVLSTHVSHSYTPSKASGSVQSTSGSHPYTPVKSTSGSHSYTPVKSTSGSHSYTPVKSTSAVHHGSHSYTPVHSTQVKPHVKPSHTSHTPSHHTPAKSSHTSHTPSHHQTIGSHPSLGGYSHYGHQSSGYTPSGGYSHGYGSVGGYSHGYGSLGGYSHGYGGLDDLSSLAILLSNADSTKKAKSKDNDIDSLLTYLLLGSRYPNLRNFDHLSLDLAQLGLGLNNFNDQLDMGLLSTLYGVNHLGNQYRYGGNHHGRGLDYPQVHYQPRGNQFSQAHHYPQVNQYSQLNHYPSRHVNQYPFGNGHNFGAGFF